MRETIAAGEGRTQRSAPTRATMMHQHKLVTGLIILLLSSSAFASADYQFDGPISRQVLENYLDRSITMEGMVHGRSDIDDDLRMLKSMGAKFIGRGICFWSGESSFARRIEMVKANMSRVRAADPDMIV